MKAANTNARTNAINIDAARQAMPDHDNADMTRPAMTKQQMSKQEMIEAIREQNRSAREDFLLGFDEQTLQAYLRRLTHLANHRGRDSVWVRRDTMRSIVTRVPQNSF